jgi:hypothetical protein
MMLCTSSKDRGSELPSTRVGLSWEWMSLTNIDWWSGFGHRDVREAIAAATEEARNSRLVIIFLDQ